MTGSIIRSQRGVAALIALIMVAMLTLLGLAALSTSDEEVTVTGNELQEVRAFYAAEAGLERAAAAIRTEYDRTGGPPPVLPAGVVDVNSCTVTYSTLDNGPARQRLLTTGILAGLYAQVRRFNLTSNAVSAVDNATIRLSQSFETALVPIYQFAIFYDNDLEIDPGPEMTLQDRVHTNGNLWMQSDNALKMDSYVTAAGSIRHGRKRPGPVGAGEVLIKDVSGEYVSMQKGTDWLDANDPHWYDSSVARWQGRVRDSHHGQGQLTLPLAPGAAGDPHRLIEPADGNPDSYEHKAGLKFIDRQALKKTDTAWVTVTGDLKSHGIITFVDDAFYDSREQRWVDVMDLNIGKLYKDGYGPDNGVIYFSDHTSDFPALRVRNGAEIGDRLTLVSENPMYCVGNFNSIYKKPAAMIADAITFLSENWNDSRSTGTVNDRVAASTIINVACVTGNTKALPDRYNGGFENLPRFLENWSGKKFIWIGSAVCLWNSRQAVGDFSYGVFYKAPIREWHYDFDLKNPGRLPPETPAVRVFRRTGWKQEYVGYDQAPVSD